jgi:hypothetical protein
VRWVRGTRRGAAALLGVSLVAGATSGCGFMNDLAHPDAAPPAAPATTVPSPAPPSSAVPVDDAPDPDEPRVIAQGELLGSGDGTSGHLVVTQGPVRTGLVPPVPGFSFTCPVEGPSLQYVAVDFAYAPTAAPRSSPRAGLAAHVSVDTGAGTPADVGDVGVFADSGGDPGPYCADYPPLPTTDTFWNQMGAATVTVFVVLDQAVTPAFPVGRSDVFPTLQLRISELRWFSDPQAQRSLTVGGMSVGAACADDPDAICVPLA